MQKQSLLCVSGITLHTADTLDSTFCLVPFLWSLHFDGLTIFKSQENSLKAFFVVAVTTKVE